MARGVWARGEGPGDGEGADGEAERRGGFRGDPRAASVASRREDRNGRRLRRRGTGRGGSAARSGWRGGGDSRWFARRGVGVAARGRGAGSEASREATPTTKRVFEMESSRPSRAHAREGRGVHRATANAPSPRRRGRPSRARRTGTRAPSRGPSERPSPPRRTSAAKAAADALPTPRPRDDGAERGVRERAAGPSRSRPRTGRRRGLGPRARVAARECCARRPRQDEPRRARVWRRRRARRATTQPEGDLETRVFALALTKYPYAKGVYSGSEGKRNHP